MQRLELKLEVNHACWDTAGGDPCMGLKVSQEKREANSDERGEKVAEIMQENSDLKEQITSITSNYQELENAVRVLHRSGDCKADMLANRVNRVQMENMSINEARANSLQVNLENEVERLQTENQALKRVNQEFEEEFSREKSENGCL